jgi:poly(A) polymerase
MNFTSKLDHPLFQELSAAAASLGLKCYVIGGFVRDLILERPCKDVDVVVEGRGIELAEAFAKRTGSGQYSFFENFGTAMVMFGDWQVEFVGARKESYSRDSRKPKVEEGTLEDDQIRRDFTINAMSISLNPDDFGTLHDPFDGVGDLRTRHHPHPHRPQYHVQRRSLAHDARRALRHPIGFHH